MGHKMFDFGTRERGFVSLSLANIQCSFRFHLIMTTNIPLNITKHFICLTLTKAKQYNALRQARLLTVLLSRLIKPHIVIKYVITVYLNHVI